MISLQDRAGSSPDDDISIIVFGSCLIFFNDFHSPMIVLDFGFGLSDSAIAVNKEWNVIIGNVLGD